jgi:flagellar biosynthesis protein FlhG
MPKILTVASGKGGVGKTNISVNLSLALNNQGFKTCLLDADLGLANANILLGLYPDRNLEDVVLNNVPLGDIVVRTEDGLELIPGSSGLEVMANLDDGRLQSTLTQLSDLTDYDFLILDCSSGIARQTVSFCLAASEVILVFTPEPTSLVDAFAMLKVLLANEPGLRIRALMSNCPDKQSAKVSFYRMKQAAAQYLGFELRPVGVVLKDSHVDLAIQKQRPLVRLYPQSTAARCLELMAGKLADEYRGTGEGQSLKDFWTRYFEVLRRPLLMPGSRPAHGAVTARVEASGEDEVETAGDREAEARPPGGPGSSLHRASAFNINLAPICPHTLLAVIRILDDQEESFERLHDLVRLDPGLGLNVLVWAKSHPGHVPAKVLNLKSALQTLGWPQIRGLAFHLAALQVLTPRTESQRRQWAEAVRESRRCGLVGEALAPYFEVDGEEAYWAGLFSNLAGLFSAKDTGEGGATRQVNWGAGILESLGLPSLFVDAVRYVDEPVDRIQQALPLVRAVHLARRLAEGAQSHEEVQDQRSELPSGWLQSVDQAYQAGLKKLGLNGEENHELVWIRTREELAAEVRTMVLETGALLTASGIDQGSVGPGHSLTVLASELGACGIMLFGHQPEKNKLTARYYQGQTGSELLNQMSLPADRGENAITRCWMSGLTCHSLNHPEGKPRQLVDEQLRRLMKVEAICCLRLSRGGRPRGVLVLGGAAGDIPELLEHPDLSGLITQATRVLAGLMEGGNRPAVAAVN